jgi:hypothetical protein
MVEYESRPQEENFKDLDRKVYTSVNIYVGVYMGEKNNRFYKNRERFR